MKTIDWLVESTSQYIHLSLKCIKMLTYDSIVCANVYFSFFMSLVKATGADIFEGASIH